MGQFQDLGYTVDYAAADAHHLSGTGRMITVAHVTVTERNAGTTKATLTFTLSSAAAQPVLFHYTTADRTARDFEQDYVLAVGSVAFPVGETSKTVSVGAGRP